VETSPALGASKSHFHFVPVNQGRCELDFDTDEIGFEFDNNPSQVCPGDV